MKINDLSIKTKLISGTTLLFVVAFIGISSFNYSHSSAALEDRITNSQLPVYVENIKYELQGYLQKGKLPAEVISGNSFIQEQLQIDVPDTIAIREYLKDVANKYGVWIGYVSEKHRVFYMNVFSIRDITTESDAWYFNLKEKAGVNTEFNVDHDVESGLLRLWTNHKIFSPSGELLGVCFTGMDVNEMKEFVLSKKFEGNGEIMVVEEQGGIMFHKDSTKVDINQKQREGKTIQTIPKYSIISDKILVRRDARFTYRDDSGKRKLVYSAYIPDFHWYTVIEVAESDILSSVRAMLFLNVGFGLLITALVVMLNIGVIDYIIIRPLRKIIQVANEFANGYLQHSLHFKQKDEVGLLANRLDRMKKQLRTIVGSIIKTSAVIVDASNELKVSSQRLSETSHQQAVNVEEVSSSMEEMLTNIHQNASNAKETGDIAQAVNKDMNAVNETVSDTVTAIRKIAEKVLAVSEIASRTDMLAINASIEASRAGAAGKGFSMVASEVRSLAENSQRTTKEIRELSDLSVELAERSKELIEELLPKIEFTSTLVQDISGASNEQKLGAETVNTAISQLSDIAQQNASSAEELAANAEIFGDQANKLIENTSFFSLDDDQKIEHLESVLKEIDRLHNVLEEVGGKGYQKQAQLKKNETKRLAQDAKAETKLKLDLGDSDFEEVL